MRVLTSFFVCLFCIILSTVAQAQVTSAAAAAAPATSNTQAVAATSTSQVAAAAAATSTTQAAAAAAATNSNIPASISNSLIVNGTLIATGIIASSTSNQSAASAANSVDALPTSASYGNSVYPGAATFLTPTASKSVSPLYRIDNNENVTFVWQFTDLLVRPQNLTLAAVAPNSVTYTIGAYAGDATSAVWQIKNVPTASPLMMGMYQVQLYDQRGISATILPGWLQPATRLTIAFYSAETYQPYSGSGYCPTCFYNGGRRVSENLGPMMLALGVASVTSAMIIYGLLF